MKLKQHAFVDEMFFDIIDNAVEAMKNYSSLNENERKTVKTKMIPIKEKVIKSEIGKQTTSKTKKKN